MGIDLIEPNSDHKLSGCSVDQGGGDATASDNWPFPETSMALITPG
ncbi:hypothetical protein RISK_005901 [Rhodopirellula islandica]|uniref:Uncharacterized protein n=1 Tax=Rhodopirellula islandica TaxID=595434 RepID=A0A0J1B5H7_RHOIS|nr:hypothetical protein RISK_005901 [Rhodopirellula islandica]